MSYKDNVVLTELDIMRFIARVIEDESDRVYEGDIPFDMENDECFRDKYHLFLLMHARRLMKAIIEAEE
jgi:hypothetical protein